MAQSLEMQAKIQEWRAKARAGTLTKEEMREAILVLRQDRTIAHATSAASKARKSAAKTPVNSEDLLSELDKL